LSPKSGIDFIGVTIRDPAALEEVMRLLTSLTEGKFEILTVKAADGTLIGLITLEKDLAEKVRKTLDDQRVPELTFPAAVAPLPFPEKIRYLRKNGRSDRRTRRRRRRADTLCPKVGCNYARVRSWLDERLALCKNTAYLHQTGMLLHPGGPRRQGWRGWTKL
jgi:V/A-type H+-transporting ATPase subunit I